MKIFTQDIHTKIRKLQIELYDKNSIEPEVYLERCFDIFNMTLKKHFKSKYVFGKLYYRPFIDASPQIVDFYGNPKNNKSKIFSTGIKQLEKLVDEGISKSLSVVIIERFLRGILLYEGDEPERIPSIIESSFSQEKGTEWFIEQIIQNTRVAESKFEEDEINGIKKLYEGHKRMAEDSKLKNVYSYLY